MKLFLAQRMIFWDLPQPISLFRGWAGFIDVGDVYIAKGSARMDGILEMWVDVCVYLAAGESLYTPIRFFEFKSRLCIVRTYRF